MQPVVGDLLAHLNVLAARCEVMLLMVIHLGNTRSRTGKGTSWRNRLLIPTVSNYIRADIDCVLRRQHGRPSSDLHRIDVYSLLIIGQIDLKLQSVKILKCSVKRFVLTSQQSSLFDSIRVLLK